MITVAFQAYPISTRTRIGGSVLLEMAEYLPVVEKDNVLIPVLRPLEWRVVRTDFDIDQIRVDLVNEDDFERWFRGFYRYAVESLLYANMARTHELTGPLAYFETLAALRLQEVEKASA